MATTNHKTLRKAGLLLFGSLFGLTSFAQFNLGFVRVPERPVLEQGQTLAFSTAGGLNTPQFSEIDLNGDGIDDLFVFDRSVDVVRTFLYNEVQDAYNYDPNFERFFPSDLAEFALLRDYDCDGRADIFTYHQAGFRVYRNTTEVGEDLTFEKITDQVRSDYGSFESAAFVLAGDVPAIVDVDGDGDLDILTFGTVNSESTIEYHRNLSLDLYTTCDSLEFEVVTQCWGNVQEAANTSLLTPINCKGVVPPSQNREEIHPGSSVLLIDTDGDGDKDLILGDIQTDDVVFAINEGDAQTATINVSSQTNQFPNSQDPVRMQYLISGYEIDVDHDGIDDLLMSVNNSIDSSVNTDHIWYYNNGASGAPSYSLEQEDFLLDEILDVGANTSVVASDLNGDGRPDLLVAVDYQRDPNGSTKSRIYRYDQATEGSFDLVSTDYASLSSFNFASAQLALGDLDGDGDDDMILGDAQGFLHYFRNDPIGGSSNHTLVAPQFMGISTIGNNASPALLDLNGDGLLDLIVGERIGTLSYFENSGDAATAMFSSAPDIADFGGIDVSDQCCTGYATPQAIENPQFGFGRFLMVGSDEKRIDIYEVPEDLTTDFFLVDSIVVNAGRLDPFIVQLNEGEPLNLVAGEAGGGMLYFERDEDYLVGLSDQSNALGVLNGPEVFPNPSRTSVRLKWNNPFTGQVLIQDQFGRTLNRIELNNVALHEFSTSTFPVGTYILHVVSDKGVIAKPLLILR